MKCSVCTRKAWLPFLKDGDQQFCSVHCMTQSGRVGFCERCLEETNDKNPGSTYIVAGGISSLLLGVGSRCPTCHSIVQRKFRFLFVIPYWWRARYRVIYLNRAGHYIGRRLRKKKELVGK